MSEYMVLAKLMITVSIGELLVLVSKALNKELMATLLKMCTIFACLTLVGRASYRIINTLVVLFSS